MNYDQNNSYNTENNNNTDHTAPNESNTQGQQQGSWQGQGGWQQNQGGWQQAQGGWQQNQGGWQQAQGGWQQNQGGWQQAQGGWQQQSAPYYPPMQMPDESKDASTSKTLGIIGLILSLFCCPLAGLILGILACTRAARAKKDMGFEPKDNRQKIAILVHKSADNAKKTEVFAKAKQLRDGGNIVSVFPMKKNINAQFLKLEQQGYNEFIKIYND